MDMPLSPSHSKRHKPNLPTKIISTISTPSSSTTSNPPLSAVAARRAAVLAASSVAVPSSDESDEEEVEIEEEEEIMIESDDYEQVTASKADTRRNGKRPEKSKSAGRYFNGVEEQEDEEDENKIMIQDDLAEGLLDSRYVPPPKVKMGRGKRMRREKSAFMDPLCVSDFSPELEENISSISWTTSDGQSRRGLILCLKAGETVVVHGNFMLLPVFGSVSIFGATLTSSTSDEPEIVLALPPAASIEHRVFSPASHPIPPIVSLPSNFGTKASTLVLSNGKSIDISSSSSIILLSDLETGIEGVDKVLKCGGLGGASRMWQAEDDVSEWGGTTWKLIVQLTPSLALLRLYDSWASTLNLFDAARDRASLSGEAEEVATPRLTLLVEGPKRVGKSTLAKLLLNRLLSSYERVAYLDTDLGQPEFTTPGIVSLNVLDRPVLGPAFTHPSVPVASHFIGSTSPSSNPSAYLSAITSLLSTYSLEIEYSFVDEPPRSRRHLPLEHSFRKARDRVPLVINTQGWVKGLGADLLEKLKGLAKPTHVFLFEAPMWEEGEPKDGGWNELNPRGNEERDGGCEVIKMESAPPSALDSKWSAADLRTLSLVSYFHSIFPPLPLLPNSVPVNSSASRWDFSLPLISQRPYSVGWATRADGEKMIEGVYIIDGEVEYSQILHALNGTIVALATSTLSYLPSDALALSNPFPYSLNAPLPSPSDSNCLGLALIRSIDPSSATFYFITPLHPSFLSSPVSLIRGSIELPLSLVLDFNNTNNEVEQAKGLVGFEWKDVPYLSVEGAAEVGGGGRKKVRKNLMRRGQN